MGVAPKEKDSKLAPSTAVGEDARSSGSISALSSAPSARSKAGHRTCSASFRNLRAQPDGSQGVPLLCQLAEVRVDGPLQCGDCEAVPSVTTFHRCLVRPCGTTNRHSCIAAWVKARSCLWALLCLRQDCSGGGKARTWRARTRCA